MNKNCLLAVIILHRLSAQNLRFDTVDCTTKVEWGKHWDRDNTYPA